VELPTLLAAALALLVVLAVSRVVGAALVRAGQPRVMAEVLAGLLLGATALGAFPGDPSAALFSPEARGVLTLLAEGALVGYLFQVGAQLDRRALRTEGRAVVLVAVAAFAVPWVLGVGLAVALHPAHPGAPLVPFALFLGTALAVTALPVLSRIATDRGLAERPAGRIALAAAASQELVVWPLLAVAVALAGTAGGDGNPLVVLARCALGLLGVVLLARVLVARTAGAARGVATLAGLGAAALLTELTGLHLVLGAFLFGAIVPREHARAGLGLFAARGPALALAACLPLAFALPALRVDLGALGTAGLGELAVVLAVAFGGKLASGTVAARAAGLPGWEAGAIGVLMNARGLVELVVLSVGLDAGLIDERLFGVMVIMALATTFAAGPLLALLERRRARLAARAVA